MRHPLILSLCLTSVVGLSACDQLRAKNEVDRAITAVNAVDQNNLSDIMLTVADPNEAVTYFTRSVKESPDRIDLRRGLATSLIRANRATEAVPVWRKVVEHPQATMMTASIWPMP